MGDAVLSSSDGGLSIASSSGGSVAFLTASDAASFATAAQGSLADTAVQPSDSIVVGDGGTIGSASDPDAMSIASGGVVTFSQGLSFGADTLDDYEEGAFQPSYSTSGAATFSYLIRNGKYLKIGRLVFVDVSLACNVADADGSELLVTGLPFSALNANSGIDIAWVRYFVTDDAPEYGRVDGAEVNLVRKNSSGIHDAGGGDPVLDTDMLTGNTAYNQLRFSACYYTNA